MAEGNTGERKGMLRAIDEVLTVKDVFADAQSTFLGTEDYSTVKTELHHIVRKDGPSYKLNER